MEASLQEVVFELLFEDQVGVTESGTGWEVALKQRTFQAEARECERHRHMCRFGELKESFVPGALVGRASGT